MRPTNQAAPSPVTARFMHPLQCRKTYHTVQTKTPWARPFDMASTHVGHHANPKAMALPPRGLNRIPVV